MRHTLALTHDRDLATLISELEVYAPRTTRVISEHPGVVLPLDITIAGLELSFVTTITTFGSARDITLSELSIETLYPANVATAALLADRPWLNS